MEISLIMIELQLSLSGLSALRLRPEWSVLEISVDNYFSTLTVTQSQGVTGRGGGRMQKSVLISWFFHPEGSINFSGGGDEINSDFFEFAKVISVLLWRIFLP